MRPQTIQPMTFHSHGGPRRGVTDRPAVADRVDPDGSTGGATSSLPYTTEHISPRALAESNRVKLVRGLRLYLFGPAVFVALLFATGSVAIAGVVAIVAMGVSHGHLERTSPYLIGLEKPLPAYAKELALGNFLGALLTLSGAFTGFAIVSVVRGSIGWSAALPGALGFSREASTSPEVVLGLTLPVLLLADLLIYVYHRTNHQSGIERLWEMHRVHHAIPQFTLALGPRAHPVETVITYGLCGIAGGLLGVGLAPTVSAAVLMACVMSPHHVNCDGRLGFLDRLLVTTEAHRWHHHVDPDDTGNYGLIFSFWDRWLGTHHEPARFSGRLGVEPGSDGSEQPVAQTPATDRPRDSSS